MNRNTKHTNLGKRTRTLNGGNPSLPRPKHPPTHSVPHNSLDTFLPINVSCERIRGCLKRRKTCHPVWEDQNREKTVSRNASVQQDDRQSRRFGKTDVGCFFFLLLFFYEVLSAQSLCGYCAMEVVVVVAAAAAAAVVVVVNAYFQIQIHIQILYCLRVT